MSDRQVERVLEAWKNGADFVLPATPLTHKPQTVMLTDEGKRIRELVEMTDDPIMKMFAQLK